VSVTPEAIFFIDDGRLCGKRILQASSDESDKKGVIMDRRTFLKSAALDTGKAVLI
jgi:hypothetical protein